MTAPDTPRERFVIAVDGPSGTGKSTVSREVARRLQAGYLDTGALYRMVALAVLDSGCAPDDEQAVAALLPQLVLVPPTDPDAQQHHLSGRDVTAEIRGAAVTTAVTPVSANPRVRSWLLELQQRLARSGRMVVEGRDIGTVIVPDAELKIYLTADERERARRRHGEIAAAATDPGATLEAVDADLRRRDLVDSTRPTAPLRPADDAEHLDSSDLTAEQVVERILRLAAERGQR